MILRIALFGLMAVGLLGFGLVAWESTHPPGPGGAAAAAPPARQDMIVLAHDVRAGTLLKADDLVAKPVTRAGLPHDAISDSPQARGNLLGAMVRHTLGTGDVLRDGDVMRPGDHGFLAAVLSPGMVAVTVAVDMVSGTAGLIWPGDRVDLILTQSMDNPALPPGRRFAAETVLQDIRVIAIDQLLVQGAVPGGTNAPEARTVTLELGADQAERVQVATRIGKLSLALRSAAAGIGSAAPRPATVWASDVSGALQRDPTATTQNVMHLYEGSTIGKEFRY